jgi:hypothetical protein
MKYTITLETIIDGEISEKERNIIRDILLAVCKHRIAPALNRNVCCIIHNSGIDTPVSVVNMDGIVTVNDAT